MDQPIGSRLHGVLDYATGASLLAASMLPPLRGRFAGRVLATTGAVTVGYSLLTDYELGVVPTVPYAIHLALDAGSALSLVAVGATRGAAIDRWVPIAVGLFELGAVALSDPSGEGA